ncbi:MAG: GNAT family N-acetyltransferase [Actinobacteria bacterium]|nr:GNAT family N-acetyltransferase [Actinomycetota bacterium]
MQPALYAKRIFLRPLGESDFKAWSEVRKRCLGWLMPWEPRPAGAAPLSYDYPVFSARNAVRKREEELGMGHGFGIFLKPSGGFANNQSRSNSTGRFIGEANLSSIQRRPFQTGTIGYWIDYQFAGNGYAPEAVVALFQFSFERLGLHRIQIAIVPRNSASRRVVDKLNLRDEGIAVRYLEINGSWEDHIIYAITLEEWLQRKSMYVLQWLR